MEYTMDTISNLDLLNDILGEQEPTQMDLGHASLHYLAWYAEQADTTSSVDVIIEGEQRGLLSDATRSARIHFKLTGILHAQLANSASVPTVLGTFIVEHKGHDEHGKLVWSVGDMEERYVSILCHGVEIVGATSLNGDH